MKQILFERPELAIDFRKVALPLIEVIDFMSETSWAMWKELLFCTSIVRLRRLSETDTHFQQRAPYRFVDFGILLRGDSEQLRRRTNEAFPYDLVRPGLDTVPPLSHGTGPHLHVQCMSKGD